jgi:hypothetical protein
MSASPASRPIVARRRVLLLAALVLLLAGAAIAVLIIKPWASTPAAAQPTVWQEITGGITNGQVPKDVALEAFAYLCRVSIPGVQRSTRVAPRPTWATSTTSRSWWLPTRPSRSGS